MTIAGAAGAAIMAALDALQPATDAAPPGPLLEWIRGLAVGWRLLAIAGIAAVAHSAVRLLQLLGAWVLTPSESPRVARELLQRRDPKVATVVGLVVSALTFGIYFVAIGFALRELTPITIGQYFASATVIGLAVGFGTQGLVQDVVTGLTLIFSDALDIGNVVEVSGQVGRIEKIGLRFTTLTNFIGQTVYVPNRNIAVIGRYRAGYARAFLDVQLPRSADEAEAVRSMEQIARSFRAQYGAVIVGEPRFHAVQNAGDDGWRYLRIRFRIWPGQQALIENALRQRAIAAMRSLDPAFADWMVTVTYRIQ
jgi:moderate conductance mechanosensitive channel